MKSIFHALAFLFLASLCAAANSTGNLKVTLAPSAAVSAGAQWRVDGGSWKNSGATVNNLSPGAHTVGFKTLSGWIAPATVTVGITNGNTTTLAATYVQPAALKITLTPASAEWRIDGGAWLGSGATAANLAPGSHTIDYAALNGYAPPASESVTLASGQSLTLNRSYVQFAQVTVTLAPSQALWRIDGGAWQASGATVANLAVGSHGIDYVAVSGYEAPPPESVTLAAGQSLALNRSYVQLAQLTVNFTLNSGNWRINGGGWRAAGDPAINLTAGSYLIEYLAFDGYAAPPSETVTLALGQSLVLERTFIKLARVTVTLTPASGQWRINGSGWYASGATYTNLAPGTYTIDYSPVSGYITPPSESVTVASGDVLSFNRSYVQPAQVSVTLSPATGQWRVYPASGSPSGAWNASGAVVAGLAPGNYAIEYGPVANYSAPATETITLAPNQSAVLSRAYVAQPGEVTVTLTPAAAQWRIYAAGSTPGGAWQNSGVTVTGLAVGDYTVEYAALTGYDTPPSETVTLTAGKVVSLARSYVAQSAQVTVTLSLSAPQWRIFPTGAAPGAWSNSGATVTGLTAGNYTIEYAGWYGFDAPPTETIALAPGQSVSLSRTYTPRPAQLKIRLNPATGQWRVYPAGAAPGGDWQASDATVSGLVPGNYTLEYTPVTGYYTPPAETIPLYPGDSAFYSRSYSARPAQITVVTNPASGQWRIYPELEQPSGAWNASGATVFGLGTYAYNIQYSALSGYSLPSENYVVFGPGEAKTITANYTAQSAQLTVTVTPSSGQWRVDGGVWRASNTTAANLLAGSHLVEFSHVVGYATPSPVTVNLAANENRALSQTHNPGNASISITLANNIGRWRVDGWVWAGSGWSWYGGSGTHAIDYEPVPGYAAPPAESVLVDADQNLVLPRAYTQLPQATLRINLTPTQGQWRIYSVGSSPSGAWNAAGASLAGIEPGNYTIEYAAVTNYNTPANETVSLSAYQTLTLDRTYAGQTGQLYIRVLPETVMTDGFPQFRAYQYATYSYSWYFAGAPVTLAAGEYDIDFAQGSWGWQEPQGFHVTIVPGQTTEVTVQYRYRHNVKFHLNANLVGSMPASEVQRRISQYAAHVRAIFARESLRNLDFVYPEYSINTVSASPFTNTGVLPRVGFEVWIYADLTDQPAVGSYGGSVGTETSQAYFGAGGADNLKWDQIHDPAALAAGSAELQQYWRQINGIVRQLEILFGAGRGGYDSLAGMSDASGVAPVLPATGPTNTLPADSFWAARPELWADPLTANSYANPRTGSPTTLPALLDSVVFAPVTKSIVNGIYHRDQDQPATLPNLSSIVVRVIDAQTQALISGASVRVWNRSTPLPPYQTYEETVSAGTSGGTFTFAWTGAPNPLNAAQNAKIVKAYAPGYTPSAGWVTIYDAQKSKIVNGQTVFEVTLQLTPQ
jgi:hypothetical protein